VVTGPPVIGALCFALGACAYAPAEQQRARVEATLRAIPDVINVAVACDGRVFASDALCATVMFNDKQTIHFERVGSKSFGVRATAIVVTKTSRLVPRVASCAGIGPPNFHRDAPFGHHFHPPLVDLMDAVTRYRQVLEEVQFWPQCPQYYELQDQRGADYRYCARRDDATEEPAPPPNCHSSR
jgi:hypothetical protein